MSLITEFKTFIQRGNVIDLAVAVIIGAAFGKIVTSLVNDVFTPPLSVATQEIHDLFFEEGKPVSPVLQHLGAFVQSVVDFLIISICVFLLVKAVNALRLQKVLAGDPPPAELTTQEKLLTEIRDLLKAQAPSAALDESSQVGHVEPGTPSPASTKGP